MQPTTEKQTIRHLVLFDIDGTLLLGNGIGREATRRAMLDVFGTAGTLDTHHFGGKTDWHTLVQVLGRPEAEVGAALPQYSESLAAHMAALVPAYDITVLPGAHDAVRTLRSRDDVMLGVVTGNLEATTPVKLQAGGFDPAWFEIGAYGSESVHRNDLPPLALQRAIAHSGQALTADHVTIIGDTVADIECARALGARVIVVSTGFSHREALLAAQPDHLLDSLEDVLALFD